MAIDFKKETKFDFQPSTNEEPKKEERGFFQRIGDVFSSRTKQFSESQTRLKAGEQTAPETGVQLAGQVIGGAGDLIFEGVRILTPKSVRNLIASGVEKVAGLEPVKDTFQAYSTWAEKNPRAAANVEAGFNIASAVPAMKATKALKAGGVKSKLASMFEGKLANQQLDDALRVIKPELNKAEKVALLSSGKTEKTWTGAIRSLPTDRDMAIAETVKDIVSPKNNPIINIKNLNSQIDTLGSQVDVGLKADKSIFNTKQLATKLNQAKEGSRVVFGSEKTIENTYDAVVSEFTKIMQGKPKTVAGLWEGRKEFDSVMKSKFPKVFNNPATTDAPRYNAINDVRRAANNYIEELLPDGNQYKAQMKNLTNIYEAKANIAEKAGSILDMSRARQVIKYLRQNPLVAGLTGGILTFGALSGLLTNPVLLSGLVLGGSYKLGKNVVTSQTLKKSLINIIKNADKLNQPAVTQSLREIVQSIDAYEHSAQRSKK